MEALPRDVIKKIAALVDDYDDLFCLWLVNYKSNSNGARWFFDEICSRFSGDTTLERVSDGAKRRQLVASLSVKQKGSLMRSFSTRKKQDTCDEHGLMFTQYLSLYAKLRKVINTFWESKLCISYLERAMVGRGSWVGDGGCAGEDYQLVIAPRSSVDATVQLEAVVDLVPVCCGQKYSITSFQETPVRCTRSKLALIWNGSMCWWRTNEPKKPIVATHEFVGEIGWNTPDKFPYNKWQDFPKSTSLKSIPGPVDAVCDLLLDEPCCFVDVKGKYVNGWMLPGKFYLVALLIYWNS